MRVGLRVLFILPLIVSSCIVVPKPVTVKTPVKKTVYKEVDLEEMIRRHISKSPAQSNSIEGIYTVSGSITKRGKTFFSPEIKDRTMVRKDNYARVAIVKDWPGSNTEYVEISLKEKNASRYPIVAEINSMAEGGGFMYKHIEPKGETMTFTFLYDQGKTDILEGVYTKTKNNTEITYKLTYVKEYPKAGQLQSGQ